MKKLSFFTSAASLSLIPFSLMLLACGDDSSATGVDVAEIDSSSSIELSSSDEALSSAAVESSSAKSAVSLRNRGCRTRAPRKCRSCQ